jgi:glycosyltransferase involved in cell wall biosynthesis
MGADAASMGNHGNKRQIWLVSNTSWYLFNFRARLISDLLSQGFSVIALSPRDEYSHKLSELGARHVHIDIDSGGSNPLRDGLLLTRVTYRLVTASPAALLTFTPKPNIYCGLAARLLGIPAVANVSGLGRAFIDGGWLQVLVKSLYKISLRKARRVFFQNPDDLAFFVGSRIVQQQQVVLLPGSGVDVHRFRPIEPPRHRAKFRFLFVGRLLRDKGVGEFVNAARAVRHRNPEVECCIAGFVDARNPTAFSRADVQAWEQEGVIKYLGVSDEMTGIYAQVDCVVLPSYREGCPRALLEAASMAIPVIATDVPGCRSVVMDQVSGYLCRSRDAADLADKMEKMLHLPRDARAAMGAAGRQRMVREFDEQTVLDQYVAAVKAFARG